MESSKRLVLVLVATIVSTCLLFCAVESAKAADETSRTNYTLMKGVTESTVFATAGNKENVRIHILRVNKGANVSFKVSTANYYKKNSTEASRKKYAAKWTKAKWGYATVEQQAANYNASKDKVGNVIAASNGDFYLKEKNGQTLGSIYMEGNKIRSVKDKPYFAVMKDGSYEIRYADSPKTDVVEAISGYTWLVHAGEECNVDNKEAHPCQSVGVTDDGDVVIANIDGKEPTSVGTTWKNLATVMKQQGCKSAILLDGGGSASFLTKRAKDKKLVFRNTAMDGAPRTVSSALLVVKNSKANNQTISGEATVSMKDPDTYLKKNANGVFQYRIEGKASKTGFVTINGLTYLFNDNGNGMTKKVKVGSTTYTFTKGKLTKSSDKKAGKVIFGFCGANNGGKNLIYAYQFGNKKLNIGLNPLIKKNSGKMKNWGDVIDVPWTVHKNRVKSTYIGKGVKNIGDRFLYISLNPFNDQMKKIKPALKTVSFPATLTKIGSYSFYNHYNLKKVTIPKSVKTISNRAFFYNNSTTFTFKRTSPPSIGKSAFTRNLKVKKAKTTFKVPNKKKWKNYLKKKANKKKIGFSGKIKYTK